MNKENMNEDVMEIYQKIKDKISQEDFLIQMNEIRKEYEHSSTIGDIDFANMIASPFIEEKNVSRSASKNIKINELDVGLKVPLVGRVMKISNPKTFKTRKGKSGQVANMYLADDTGTIRVVLWTESIPKIKNVKEGDIIEISRVEVKDGYRGNNEAQVQARSSIKILNSEDFPDFPAYEEDITSISDVISFSNPSEYEEFNVIARITRIPKIRNFESNGKEGQVVSLELKDQSGTIDYTLWNKDTKLIKELDLKEGDGIKVIGARRVERNDEVSLYHPFVGRIIKGDYDLPNYSEKILKIDEANEGTDDAVFFGVVSRVQDRILFDRPDASQGSVRSVDITDNTGTIRITLWGDDTEMEINRNDILKISRGLVEFDEYTESGLRINTNWNSRIDINPEIEDSKLKEELEKSKVDLVPKKIAEIQDIFDDGEEIDVLGRVFRINDIKEFQREDDSVGQVRSVEIADDSGKVRLSLWDQKADTILRVGQAIFIENARTKMGLYNVDLNIGKTTRIIPASPEDDDKLPSLEKIEEIIYSTKTIKELEEDDFDVRIIARILDFNEVATFSRDDGSEGSVRSVEIADDTGVVKCSFWDEQAEKHFKIGDAIKIENPTVKYRNDHIELNIGRHTFVKAANDSEIESLGSFDEIQEKAYVDKNIDDLEEGDTNIRINGKLTNLNSEKLVLYRCPHCNAGINLDDDITICETCGETVDEPNHLLMISGRFEDEKGSSAPVTFFNQLVEKLLSRTKEGIIEIISKSTDDFALRDEIEDLNGVWITLIADVDFDDYNEEIRLKPKKIIDNY